ncbi:Uncharacterised protein [Salmonella enterica subsp. enterica serovar Bovismorbificans]|uniref:Uncharacterized protein n=1 Tax=Salmonella enterica subsp. enterica serovar Bovismorbificans TaxID=58097 RepID=A0A655BXS1_SALET|nr:Uncharacterised protein [Salmonella enterica subsp. enterica serovar Bovismorbificans]CNT71265.1 Uncharacterised protein [Salmonella enterica subsp. enterica serovar Bovismorbificans]CNT83676.1 Uncharacterised protein [Salmonella enterica subsp. enterica serovar Bovismorbificans]CNT92221.1 Uncharacterised protein [Salmonella enterica subsp. enterica serovar Bovismorbificans]CNU35471.1 Uncharacterised protein [Salmonella enterica subsp. enterica serovar Bovismorbificans]
MNMAQIQRWIRNGKRLVVIPRFQRVTQLHDMANRIVHQFNGVNPTRRVAGMTGLPQDANDIRDMPFVRAYRLQRRRFANDRAVRT